MKNQDKKKVLALCGSNRVDSTNLKIIKAIRKFSFEMINVEIYDQIRILPYFNPDMDNDQPPALVKAFRDKIREADGVLICTPEYVYSLPGVLKNAIEWCVSTTVFSLKPVALITASSSGEKAHESLQLIMKTLYANFSDSTQLLIKGAKTKIEPDLSINDYVVLDQLKELLSAFIKSMN
jgi:Predicted flavoprotein